MIRGTTPTLYFTVPIDPKDLRMGYITFAQNREVILDKELSECTINDNTIAITLTQEETLLFNATVGVEIQLRARDALGNAIASQIVRVDVSRILKDGVI